MKQHAQVYQTNMAMCASTLEMVITVYNVAIAACRNKNAKRVCDALCLLLQSIKSEPDKELAKQLCQFYAECGELAKGRYFAEAESMLLAVREVWCHLDNKQKTPMSTPPDINTSPNINTSTNINTPIMSTLVTDLTGTSPPLADVDPSAPQKGRFFAIG